MREPEPWESDAPGPLLRIEGPRATVEVWAYGDDRFAVRLAQHKLTVVGFASAQQTAQEVAKLLA